MSKLWVFGLEFVVLGVLANVVAHYLIEWYEESKEIPAEERA
ncbi:MAG: hypothetical protein WB930_00010 [Syntrophobacteraceae bacterium]